MAEFEHCTNFNCPHGNGSHAHVVGFNPEPELMPIAKAAASIAQMVDEYESIGLNSTERAELAKMVEKRLQRFWPK